MSETNKPVAVQVEAGKNYFWCPCGLSAKVPLCDGSHKAEGKFKPVKFEATETHEVYFCNCRQTKNGPLCDGSHKSL